MGSYKWLLLYTTVFEIVYTVVNFFGGPSVHTYGSAFIAFLDTDVSYFGSKVDEIFIYTYCSCFGFSMSIFSAHFIYRYGAINESFFYKYLRGPKQIILYILPIISGSLWGIICRIFFRETLEKTEYLRNTMMENYALNIDRCVYVSARFWLTTENGRSYPDFLAFFAILLVWIVLGASLSSVLYFGVSCYRWISKLLENTASQSQLTKGLQSQLFNALLVQSALPLLLMYAPTGIVFIFPMLNIQLNINYGFVGLTIAIYPAIDPFPTIFIIKRYRTTFKNKTEKNIVIQKAILNTVIVGAAVFSISSVLSAGLIAVTSNMEDPPLDPDTVSTYAVIPGLISYSCNFYVYYWRSTDYRNAFIKQLCCGKVLTTQEKVVSVMSVSNVSVSKRATLL